MVNFGIVLKANQVPNWVDYYIDYDTLATMIKNELKETDKSVRIILFNCSNLILSLKLYLLKT